MKTLRELIEENKDKFATGGFKCRGTDWSPGRYFHVLGVNQCGDAIGYDEDGLPEDFDLEYDGVGEYTVFFELYPEPKPKVKLYPFLLWSDFGREAHVRYFKSEDEAIKGYASEVIGPHPTLEPIEVDAE